MKKSLMLFLFVAAIIGLKASVPSQKTIIDKIQVGIYDNPDEAIRLGENLLKTEKNTDKITEINLLISNAYIAKRDFDTSLKYILKAKETLNNQTDDRIKAYVLTSISVQYQQMALYSKSLETLDEAENFISKLKSENPIKHTRLGIIYAIRGMIFKSQSNPELALQKFIIAEQNTKLSANQSTKFGNLSIILYNMAYCYIDMNRHKESKLYFEKSVNYAKQAKANSLEAFALKGLAEMFLLDGNNIASLEMLTKAEQLSQNIGDIVLNEGIYKGFADNYLATNQLQKYRFYNKKYFNTQFLKEQNELKSINRSIDNQSKENQIAIKNITKKHTLINWLAVAVFATAFFYLLYLIRKSTSTNNRYKSKIKELMSA